jgi:serpin B
MKQTFKILSLVLLAATLSVPFASAAQPPLATANNSFAARLYAELSHKTENLSFSPYSIASALGMAYAGARGNTAREIRQTLHFPLDPLQLSQAFQQANKDLMTVADRDGLKLTIANGLFLTGGGVSDQFEATLKNDYDAELFSDGVGQINAWVRQKTEGRIGKIIDRIGPNSVCVILNAIYFKGSWKSPFAREATRNAPFNLSSTAKVTAPLMHRRGNYKMVDGKDFQAVSLPYRGDDLSMVILLPRATEGLAGLEKRLTAAKLGDWLQRLDRQPSVTLDLYVPKFTMRTGYDLKPSLMKLGMKKAFTKQADFSAMRPSGDLWIGQIKHKVFLTVNEEGTVAAAATAGEMRTTAVRRYPVFRADHPFFFLIRDNRNSMILFLGRLADPNSK